MKKLLVGIIVGIVVWLGYHTYTRTVSVSASMDYHPVAKVNLSTGDYFEMVLYPEEAPNTVNNFIYLVEKGFYDGTQINRILPEYLIQGGDPIGNGKGFPGYFIESECQYNGVSNRLKHEEGVVSMARSESFNTEGSQFFIMLTEDHRLNGRYSAFGKITEGLEEIRELSQQPTDLDNHPLTPVFIEGIEVECYGRAYLEPEVLSVREVLAQHE